MAVLWLMVWSTAFLFFSPAPRFFFFFFFISSRLEPFTQLCLELHSGRFDVPDRMFYDMATSYRLSSEVRGPPFVRALAVL